MNVVHVVPPYYYVLGLFLCGTCGVVPSFQWQSESGKCGTCGTRESLHE
jgi:hypothetical protein